MTLSPPKCAVNMEQRLAALRRDQEIDGLRVYMIKYDIFPRNRDPYNSPIRVEELKELVKHWKLHRQRGFWRDHPEKDDLVRALLQHIKNESANKKRRQEAQEKFRNKMGVGKTKDAGKAQPDYARMLSPGANGQETKDLDESTHKDGSPSPIKKWCGDLFYTKGHYDEGLIYLSRIDQHKFRTEERNPCSDLLTTSSAVPTPLSHLIGKSEANETKKQAAPASFFSQFVEPMYIHPNTTVLTKEMKLKCLEGLYNLSCRRGYEMQILREGAMMTILNILKTDDTILRVFAAATIANLTAVTPAFTLPTHGTTTEESIIVAPGLKELFNKLIDDGAFSALIELSHTLNITVKSLCARTLLRLTIDESHRFRMVHEGCVVVLSMLMSTMDLMETREMCLSALVNLASIPRAIACDSILSMLILLMREAGMHNYDMIVRLAQVLVNLSMLPTTRSILVEEGAIDAMEILTSYKDLKLYEMITCALSNLSSFKTNQASLVKKGGIQVLSNIFDAALTNLNRVCESTESNEESYLASEDNGEDGNCGDRSDSHKNLLYDIRRNCTSIISMLCCNKKLKIKMQQAGFVPKLLHTLQDLKEETKAKVVIDTEKNCIIALANLAMENDCRPVIVEHDAVAMFIEILQDSTRQSEEDLMLKLDCVTTLSNLILHPKNFTRLVDEGVVPTFISQIQTSDAPETQRACVYAMLNLAKDVEMSTKLATVTTASGEGAISCMQSFASKNMANAELCGVCVNFFYHLSCRESNLDVLYDVQVPALLVQVLQLKVDLTRSKLALYLTWLDCLLTLSNLASATEQRMILIKGDILRALERLLNVLVPDGRPIGDHQTITTIVKAQFTIAQLLFKLQKNIYACKNEERALVQPPFVASLLHLTTQAALRNSHFDSTCCDIQQKTALWCALTAARMTLIRPGLNLLAVDTEIPPALNLVMRTGLHEAQICAAVALCNLATYRGDLRLRPWKNATIDDFVVITLLRINSDCTKAICARALFNLLCHNDTRDQMVKDGVLYALIKLARLANEEVRDLSLRAIYNISIDEKRAMQLLDLEIVRILGKMYQPDFNRNIKRILAATLCNLTGVPEKLYHRKIVDEGMASIIKQVIRSRDPETRVFAANALYNLSCVQEVIDPLIRDEANAIVLLLAEIKAENKEVRRLAALSLANISGNLSAVKMMTELESTSVISVLNDSMKKTMASCFETTGACVLVLRNLFNIEENQIRLVQCQGVKTLASVLASSELQAETNTLSYAMDMLCTLANMETTDRDVQTQLVRDGIVKALAMITKGIMEHGNEALSDHQGGGMRMSIVTALSNLSTNASCHEMMVRDGALEIVALLAKTNTSDPRTQYKGVVAVKGETFIYHCAVLLRNLSVQKIGSLDPSRYDSTSLTVFTAEPTAAPDNSNEVKNERLASNPNAVQLLLAMSQSSVPETREHIIMALHSFATIKRCRYQIIRNDGVKIILKLGQAAASALKRHVCALTLQSLAQQDSSDDPYVTKILQEGLVSAIGMLGDTHVPHEVLVNAEKSLMAIVSPNLNPAQDASAPRSSLKEENEEICLKIAGHQMIVPRSAGPDWEKVVITSMDEWPEVDALANGEVVTTFNMTSLEVAEPVDNLQDLMITKGTDSTLEKGQRSHWKRKAKKEGSGDIPAAFESSVSAPRHCDMDSVLGTFQTLVDLDWTKVQVDIEAELASRRPTTAESSKQDELPRLRPGTSPEDASHANTDSQADISRSSSLASVRQNPSLATSNSSVSISNDGRELTPSSLTPKRKSRMLAPLQSPPKDVQTDIQARLPSPL